MHRFRLSPVISLVGVLALGMIPNVAAATVTAPAASPSLQVSAPVHAHLSQPLSSLAAMPRTHSTQPRVRPLRPLPQASGAAAQSDAAVQTIAGPQVAATVGLNFAGIASVGAGGGGCNCAPPDTEGNVGATQYVQFVNTDFQIYNKTTGASILGPLPGNALWQGATTDGCATNNDGDPVVQYDKAAQRWILTQFSISTTPFLQCVAVSLTNDATGSYWLYDFSMPNFNDYPKFSVWPDGYYSTYNMFNASGTAFVGARTCAMQSAAMRGGQPALNICFQFNSTVAGLLTSDLDGTSPPPAGAPNYVMNLGTDNSSLNLWKFHVDYVNTSNSTLTGPTRIPVTAFTLPCGGTGGTCVPQPSTGQKLDTLGDRAMYRLAYRNFPGGTKPHESMVLNHSVSVSGGASIGVRWYEFRNPSTTLTVRQQSTFKPDATSRWMGSIAMDKVGDIALGYSASSTSVFPSVRYTGRVPTDALNTMEAEATIKAGSGSQNGLSRWGDYSAMTIDPVDNCTFWYTNQYLKTTGSFNWSTQIASLKFPGCH